MLLGICAARMPLGIRAAVMLGHARICSDSDYEFLLCNFYVYYPIANCEIVSDARIHIMQAFTSRICGVCFVFGGNLEIGAI